MPYQSGSSFYLTDEDCETAFSQCKSCRFVTENNHYKEVVDGCFLRVADTDVINAYCATISDPVRSYLRRNMPSENWNKYGHLLTITTGMMRWLTVVGHVCEYMERTHKIGEAKKMLEWASKRLTSFEAGSDFVQRFLDEFKIKCDGRRDEVVRIYSIACVASVLAHELGHASLGHMHYHHTTPTSIVRNDEREADLFASSVMHSIGNGYVGAIAAVAVEVSFAWMTGSSSLYVPKKDLKKPNHYATHPVSFERVRNFIESFNAVLTTSPITDKMLIKLMEKGK